jgi:hypothetical protein
MVQPRFRPMEEIVDRLRDRDRHKENASRLAHSFGEFETTGWGEFRFETAIMFESPYVERPSVSYGWSLIEDEGEKIRDTRFPRCSGGVVMWDVNDRGLYRGAWVLVTVEDRSALIAPTVPDPDPDYTIIHDFTFLGVMMKDILPPLHIDATEV